jgi:acyl-CoA hydrolase
MASRFAVMTAEEAAAYINHGDTIAFSGFTPAGAAKAVPEALAARARQEHGRGKDFRLRVHTGASSGRCIDEDLAAAGAIMWRAPYQTGDSLRKQINRIATRSRSSIP